MEIDNLKELFEELDKDGNGSLTIDEIKEGVKNSKSKNKENILKTFESIDTD